MLAYTCICSTFTSSIFSAATREIAEVFGVSREVATLSTPMYVLGYAFGPILWVSSYLLNRPRQLYTNPVQGPLSELYGRRLPIIIAMFGFSVFNAGVATAKDLQTIFICRFFAGLFGSSPLSIVAAIFADIFDNAHRGMVSSQFPSKHASVKPEQPMFLKFQTTHKASSSSRRL